MWIYFIVYIYMCVYETIGMKDRAQPNQAKWVWDHWASLMENWMDASVRGRGWGANDREKRQKPKERKKTKTKYMVCVSVCVCVCVWLCEVKEISFRKPYFEGKSCNSWMLVGFIFLVLFSYHHMHLSLSIPINMCGILFNILSVFFLSLRLVLFCIYV